MENWLGSIERLGNRLPDPVSLFLILIALTMLGSALAAALHVSAVHPGTGEAINAVNLLSAAQLQKLLLEMPQTFTGFAPFGMVLTVMLGIGIADRSGLIGAVLRAFVTRMPPSLLSGTLVFAGILSHVAADAGYVVLIPLGALLFHSAGRHPLAGLCAAFAGVSAGFAANLLLTALDPVLAGLTQAAARLLQPDYSVAVTANYYLTAALAPAFILLGVLITEKLIEPYLGPYEGSQQEASPDQGIGPVESKGLWLAAGILLIWVIVVLVWTVPEHGLLRSASGTLEPFYKSMVALMMIGFLLPGIAYGLATKKIRNDKDAVALAAESMSDMGHYIVLAFMAAHLIVLFQWSNLGIIIAIKGAALLQQLGLQGLILILAFMLITGLLDLFIGSASAKWALMAPVFVPMLMLLGYPPELTQAAYRIPDSVTNVLTPLMPYFPLVLIFGRKYVPSFGVGSLITLMLPYSISFGVASTLTLVAWMMFGWPIGPGN
ncbi:MAG TPA: AbgT family transporter [Gammaproteobacteria bacterium]|nr:AbgT family transporter [Gammaproteobacteria bacterium]